MKKRAGTSKRTIARGGGGVLSRQSTYQLEEGRAETAARRHDAFDCFGTAMAVKAIPMSTARLIN